METMWNLKSFLEATEKLSIAQLRGLYTQQVGRAATAAEIAKLSPTPKTEGNAHIEKCKRQALALRISQLQKPEPNRPNRKRQPTYTLHG